MRGFWILVIPLFIFISCIKITDPIEITPGSVYLEGQQIPGTEIFFPLGFNAIDSRPKVSPDGNFIVYENEDPTVPPGLYLLNLITSEKSLLIEAARNPDWSPDGQWIAFNWGTHIFKIKTNRDSLLRLTTQGRNFFPDWSPDGEWIAYDRSLADASGPGGIWVMRNDGSEKRWIGEGREPSWRSSNQEILGTINEVINGSSYWKLVFYHINPDSLIGTSEFKNKNIRVPEYSPEGSQIALYASESASSGIWIINADGSNPKRILPNLMPDDCCDKKTGLGVFAPSWYPDAKHIIYEHFKITRYEIEVFGGPFWEGYYSFFKVNVDSALAISNLP